MGDATGGILWGRTCVLGYVKRGWRGSRIQGRDTHGRRCYRPWEKGSARHSKCVKDVDDMEGIRYQRPLSRRERIRIYH